MKSVLAAAGLFVALVGLGVACGPKETYCYKEQKSCAEALADKQNAMNQSDAGDAGETAKICYGTMGQVIPCPN